MRAFQADKPYQALRLTRQVLGLLREEGGGLFQMEGEQYENMARNFWVVGDGENAERYGRLVVEGLRVQGFEIGEGDGDALEGLWRRFEEEEGPRV